MYKYNHFECGGIGFFKEELPLLGTLFRSKEILDLEFIPFLNGIGLPCCTCGKQIQLVHVDLSDFEECDIS